MTTTTEAGDLRALLQDVREAISSLDIFELGGTVYDRGDGSYASPRDLLLDRLDEALAHQPTHRSVDREKVEARAKSLCDKLYAHHVIKYDPAAALRCAIEALAASEAARVYPAATGRRHLTFDRKDAEHLSTDPSREVTPLYDHPQRSDHKAGFRVGAFPRATGSALKGGWTIDPAYLKKVQAEVEAEGWDTQWEAAQTVLLHAERALSPQPPSPVDGKAEVEGWQTVPIEPDEEMLAAGDAAMVDTKDTDNWLNHCRNAWEAMLAAAPRTDDQTKEP